MAGKQTKTLKKKDSKANTKYNLLKCNKHELKDAEIQDIQASLLDWYDENQRILPWREIAKTEVDPNIRGYAIWISEVMLQQTQVATVISYFNSWMSKWPTVESLAAADLEEINKVWAGLGYYSRARRLHEGAKIIVEKLNSQMPQTVTELMNLIPGIGMYSASAIASVAFQKVAGVVDGNVIRVLSRMRAIGSHVTQPGVRDHLWELANKVVSKTRPGDFNQALMELGAVICTPQNPKCVDCPVNSFCKAYAMVKKRDVNSFFKRKCSNKNTEELVEVPDIENGIDCHLCLPLSVWKKNSEVTAFPCKAEKKTSRVENVGVVVISKGNELLMTKRPEKGLLAGLWEFPSIIYESSDPDVNSEAVNHLLHDLGIPASVLTSRKYIGEVLHIFSHIRTTYIVEHLILKKPLKIKKISKELKWLTSEEIKEAAVSTAMKKVLAAIKKSELPSQKEATSKKRKRGVDNSKQTSIKSFFS